MNSFFLFAVSVLALSIAWAIFVGSLLMIGKAAYKMYREHAAQEVKPQVRCSDGRVRPLDEAIDFEENLFRKIEENLKEWPEAMPANEGWGKA